MKLRNLAVIVLALAAINVQAFCTLDVDDDGNTLATTDGILSLRYMLGFRGMALVAGAVNSQGNRTDVTAIENYLAQECYAATESPTGFPTTGVWIGTANATQTLFALITERGRLWGAYTYGATAQQPNPPFAGFFHGQLSASGNTLTGTNVRDTFFGDRSTVRAQPTGTFTPNVSINANVFYPLYNASANVAVSYSPLSTQSPSLAQVAGSYAGYTVSSYDGATQAASGLVVNSDGTFSYATTECALVGRLNPRLNGMYFDFVVSFSEDRCVYPLARMRGTAVYDAANRQLLAVVTNNDQNIGFLIYGQKP
jgi:hypothetical protein